MQHLLDPSSQSTQPKLRRSKDSMDIKVEKKHDPNEFSELFFDSKKFSRQNSKLSEFERIYEPDKDKDKEF